MKIRDIVEKCVEAWYIKYNCMESTILILKKSLNTELEKHFISKDEIENKMNPFIAESFEEIQRILDAKEKSNDINLDIKIKIYAKLHQMLVYIKKDLIDSDKKEVRE